MAVFRLNSASVFTIGGNAIPCVTAVTIDEAADDYVSACMGQTSKAHIIGLTNISGSINGEIDASGVTTINYIQVGDSGAMVLRPAGITTGMLDITSTSAKVMSRQMAFSSTALSTYTAGLLLDDLTVAAISP